MFLVKLEILPHYPNSYTTLTCPTSPVFSNIGGWKLSFFCEPNHHLLKYHHAAVKFEKRRFAVLFTVPTLSFLAIPWQWVIFFMSLFQRHVACSKLIVTGPQHMASTVFAWPDCTVLSKSGDSTPILVQQTLNRHIQLSSDNQCWQNFRVAC